MSNETATTARAMPRTGRARITPPQHIADIVSGLLARHGDDIDAAREELVETIRQDPTVLADRYDAIAATLIRTHLDNVEHRTRRHVISPPARPANPDDTAGLAHIAERLLLDDYRIGVKPLGECTASDLTFDIARIKATEHGLRVRRKFEELIAEKIKAGKTVRASMTETTVRRLYESADKIS
jgi:hypothetical protein